MPKENDSATAYREVVDDAMLRAAGIVIDEDLTADFERAAGDASLPCADPERAARLLADIARAEGRRRRGARIRRGALRCARFAAVFALAGAVTFGGLFVGVSAFRARVLNYFYSRLQTHAELTPVDGDARVSAAVPDGWPYEWYPSWIPEGFALDKIRVAENYTARAWYRNETGGSFFYTQYQKIGNFSVNTEDLISSEIEIFGYRAILNVNEGNTFATVYIFVGEGLIGLGGDISQEDALQCAESIF